MIDCPALMNVEELRSPLLHTFAQIRENDSHQVGTRRMHDADEDVRPRAVFQAGVI